MGNTQRGLSKETGLLRATALNLGFGAVPQLFPFLRTTAGISSEKETGLLRAVALDQGFGAVPQLSRLLYTAAGGTN